MPQRMLVIDSMGFANQISLRLFVEQVNPPRNLVGFYVAATDKVCQPMTGYAVIQSDFGQCFHGCLLLGNRSRCRCAHLGGDANKQAAAVAGRPNHKWSSTAAGQARDATAKGLKLLAFTRRNHDPRPL